VHRRATGAGGALLGVLAALTAGCSSGHKTVTPPTAAPVVTRLRPATTQPAAVTSTTGDTAATTAPTAAPTTTTPPTAPPTGLAALILSTVPSGYVLQPDSVADTGPTDLNRAAADDAALDGRTALVDAGFVRGYQRQWSSADASGTTLVQDFVFLYEFETPAGAQSYAQHWNATLTSTNQGVTLHTFTPSFIPGALGLKAEDSTGSTGVVMFSKGVYAVEATVNGGTQVDQSGPAGQLALAQFQKLP